MKNTSAHNGFTLVEMLVVIGIITLLVGASISGFSKMRATAERAKVQELVSNTATALTALYQNEGAWPKRLAANGSSDGVLDANAALPLAKGGYLSLTMNSEGELDGLDKFGVADPWATAVIKRKGRSASESDIVNGEYTIKDHLLHYALDMDGDGVVNGASVGGESVSVRASAIVWCAGKDGKMEPYSKGLKKDDLYSWTPGMARKAD